jgi:predicted RNase H-like HicB family nuclease
MSEMRYAIVIEGIEGEFSAYVPDLPGCVAAGDTLAEVIELMGEAVRMHIEGLQEDGLPVPIPSTIVDYVTT